jgi:hypothetical protein
MCEACQTCADLAGDCALPYTPPPAPEALTNDTTEQPKDISAVLDAAAEEKFGI